MTTATGGGAGTPDQVAQIILQKLSVTDPALSLEIGTPERNIIDAVAEAISESTIDNYLLGNNLDIDSKSGIDLENYVNVFGFSRQAGRFATGTVTFTLAFPATAAVTVPVGTQVYVPAAVTGSTDLVFNTTEVGVIPVGTQTITIPVQCTVIGVVGDVASTAITGFIGGIGVSSVTNSGPTTGGVDAESDAQLRQRFKRTFLRNIAGTRDFYAALMLQNVNTSQALVIGPYSYYKEEIQFSGGTKVFSTNTQIKYLWPQGWYLYQNQGLPNEVFYVSGVDFVVDTSLNPPGITPFHPALTVAGATADFEYQYSSKCSRNDPFNNVANKVDIFINGTQTTDVSEQVVCASTVFNTQPSSPYYVLNYSRTTTLATPTSGHRFQPFGSVPMVTTPEVIYSPTTTYQSGTDYVGVNSLTLDSLSSKELVGVEWLTATPPAAGVTLTLTYTYNRLPEIMQALINAQKQITTDVLVHQARYQNLLFSVVVVYNFGVDVTATNAAITNALTTYVANSGFGMWVQFSDIIQIVHNVAGVENCRLARSSDVAGGVAYAVANTFNGTTLTQYTTDFRLPDNYLPAFAGVKIIRKSANSFNSGL